MYPAQYPALGILHLHLGYPHSVPPAPHGPRDDNKGVLTARDVQRCLEH